jgi:hypothetical protein
VSVAPVVVARTEEKLAADDVDEEVEDTRLVTLLVTGGAIFDLFVLKTNGQMGLQKSLAPENN